MVSTSSRVWINRVRLLILLGVSSGGKMCFFFGPRSSLTVWYRDKGWAVPSRVSPLILHTPESGAYSQDSSRFPRRRPFIYTDNRHRVSPEFIGSHDCVPMAFPSENPPAQGPHVVPVTDAAFSGTTMDYFFMRLSFPTPTNGMYVVDKCDT